MGCVSLVLRNNSSSGKLNFGRSFPNHLKADHVHTEWCQPSLSSLLQQPADIRAGPQDQALEQTLSTIYWMWQQKDTHHELGDDLWQGILSVTLILSDKNIVTGRHLGNKEAGAFQVI